MNALLHEFFCRPAELVGPELLGCRLVKRQRDGSLVLLAIAKQGQGSLQVEIH